MTEWPSRNRPASHRAPGHIVWPAHLGPGRPRLRAVRIVNRMPVDEPDVRVRVHQVRRPAQCARGQPVVGVQHHRVLTVGPVDHALVARSHQALVGAVQHRFHAAVARGHLLDHLLAAVGRRVVDDQDAHVDTWLVVQETADGRADIAAVVVAGHDHAHRRHRGRSHRGGPGRLRTMGLIALLSGNSGRAHGPGHTTRRHVLITKVRHAKRPIRLHLGQKPVRRPGSGRIRIRCCRFPAGSRRGPRYCAAPWGHELGEGESWGPFRLSTCRPSMRP